MILDNIADYLEMLGTVTTQMSDDIPRIFLHESPSEGRKETYVLLVSDLTGFAINEETPDYHKGAIQLITSATKHDEGYNLALQLSNELRVYRKELEDIYILRCVPNTLPISYRRNEQNLVEHSVNFNVVLRLNK